VLTEEQVAWRRRARQAMHLAATRAAKQGSSAQAFEDRVLADDRLEALYSGDRIGFLREVEAVLRLAWPTPRRKAP